MKKLIFFVFEFLAICEYCQNYIDLYLVYRWIQTVKKVKTLGDSSWSESNDIHEFPTNAFGLVDFINEDTGSNKPAKYVRLSDETPMSKIQTLLVDYWSILKPQRPHLALSLIGGAKNFKMEGRKKEIFKNGLISAAKSTNALILTGGNNIGLYFKK